jgi:arsenate reductase-like glutaredoxin family protein
MTDYRYTIGTDTPMFHTPDEAEEWAADNICGTYSIMCLVWDDHAAEWVEEGYTYQEVCAEIRRLVDMLRSYGIDFDDRWELLDPEEIGLSYQELRDELSDLRVALSEDCSRQEEDLLTRLREYLAFLQFRKSQAEQEVREWLDDASTAHREEDYGSMGAAAQELADHAGDAHNANVVLKEFERLFGAEIGLDELP